VDVLSDIVDLVRLRGVLYFDAEFRPPWGVTVPAFQKVARYHFVTRGHCYGNVKGTAEPLLLEAGDLVVIPHGAEHVLRDQPKTRPTHLDQVLADSGYGGAGCLVYGRGDRGDPCRLVCGHFDFEGGMDHALLRALPALIHVPAAAGASISWLDDALRYIAAEVAAARPGHAAIVKRLSEIVFVQTVRAAANHPGMSMRSLAGYSDPRIGRALHALHHAPDRPWTVASLAAEAGLSRTRFAVQFQKLLGIAPLTYATQWRMQQGRRLLVDPRRNVLDVANQVGYASEAAFSRAYARAFGASPRRHRASQPAPTQAEAVHAPLQLKRVTARVAPEDGQRVLVDRLWPRGVSRRSAAIDLWLKDIAPSSPLRHWFGHEPTRWAEFRRRYFRELNDNLSAVGRLRSLLAEGPVTLVYAARSPYNNAVALAEFLNGVVQ
jgi:AraC family transcriptional regulator, activator of mtrCDE